jgi:type II secretory pathway pseudopilin PulG
MKKLHFTIVELLIAMGLMMLVTNILSTIYARMSQQSVRIVKEQSDRVLSQMAMNVVARDFSNARINNGGSGSGGRVFRLLSSFADFTKTGTGINERVIATDFLAEANVKQTSPEGYPYLVMTTTDKSVTTNEILTGVSDGYKEVAYWLVPNDTDNNANGVIKDTLKLIRAEHNKANSSFTFFEENNFEAVTNSSNIILDDVVAVSFSFGKNKLKRVSAPQVSYNNTLTDSTRRYVFADRSVSPIEELSDVSPDYVDVLISTVDLNNELYFTIAEGKGGTVSFKYHDIQDVYSTTPGLGISETFLEFEGGKKYTFPLEGHVWNKESGYVLHYRKIGQTFYFTIQSGSDESSVSIDEESELYITKPLLKRIYLK